MFKPTQLLVLLFLGSFVSAGPACAKRNEGLDSCLEKCGSKWGWPGRVMGTDPWGNVINVVTTTDSLGAVATQACRVRPTSSSAPMSSALPAGAVGSQAPGFSSVPVSSTIQAPAPPITTESPIINVTTTRATPSISSSVSAPSSSSAPKPSVNLVPNVSSSSEAAKTSAPPPPPKTSSTPAPKPETSAPPPAPKTTSVAPPPPPPATTTHAAAPTTTTKAAPPPTTTTSTNSGSSSSSDSGDTSSSDIEQYLSAHNSVRAQHGAVALTWNNTLADAAQKWANNCVFQHSGGTLGPFGENLAAGTGSSYDITAAVQSWTDEVSEYNPSDPQASHFTQVVWKATTQLGCAEQECSGIFDPSYGLAKFFVCEYFVQGNVIGEFPENVQV